MVRLFIFAAVMSLVLSGSSIAQPGLKIPNDRFEMGTIPQYSVVTHSFWFTSTGSDTLVINEIKTPCGCSVASMERNWIPPGDSMLVTICWDVKKRVGPSGGYPYIYTNAGPDPLRVYMTGTIARSPDSTRPVTIKPFVLDVSKFKDHDIDSLRFKITNHSDTTFSVTPMSFNVDECDITLPDSVGARTSTWGTIKVKPEYLDKEFYKSITLLLNDQRETRITIPIKRKIY